VPIKIWSNFSQLLFNSIKRNLEFSKLQKYSFFLPAEAIFEEMEAPFSSRKSHSANHKDDTFKKHQQKYRINAIKISE
jgi:hypothetical protein